MPKFSIYCFIETIILCINCTVVKIVGGEDGGGGGRLETVVDPVVESVEGSDSDKCSTDKRV